MRWYSEQDLSGKRYLWYQGAFDFFKVDGFEGQRPSSHILTELLQRSWEAEKVRALYDCDEL